MVTGSDDMIVRIFNYNTLEKSHSFEAHTDYIRSIAVHPTHPYILTSSGIMGLRAILTDHKMSVFEHLRVKFNSWNHIF